MKKKTKSKEDVRYFYTISVLSMLFLALFYIIIIPDLEAYSDSKRIVTCNDRVGNYNCFKPEPKKVKENITNEMILEAIKSATSKCGST